MLLDREKLLAHYGERHRGDCAPGGAYFLHVELHRAERDGDAETAEAIRSHFKARSEVALASMMQAFSGRADKSCPLTGADTLATLNPSDLAARLRALMTQNDPDAIRAGLAEIADALDSMAGNGVVEAEAA